MKLFDDIQNKKLLVVKGLLFLLIAVLSGLSLIVETMSIQTLLLLGIFGWSCCRFYYFLFYVLERYAGRERAYSGIVNEIKHLLRK